MSEHTDNESIRPHGIIAKVFHWGFVLVFTYAIYKQVDNVEQLQDTALLRFEIFFALTFLLLLIVRFVYMHKTHPTALPENTPKLMKRAARIGHLATYVSVAMIAVSGLLIGALYGIGIQTGIMMNIAIGLHELSVLASYAMIALHIVAAIYHRLKGDGIWSAMVPVWKENNNN